MHVVGAAAERRRWSTRTRKSCCTSKCVASSWARPPTKLCDFKYGDYGEAAGADPTRRPHTAARPHAAFKLPLVAPTTPSRLAAVHQPRPTTHRHHLLHNRVLTDWHARVEHLQLAKQLLARARLCRPMPLQRLYGRRFVRHAKAAGDSRFQRQQFHIQDTAWARQQVSKRRGDIRLALGRAMVHAGCHGTARGLPACVLRLHVS